MSHSNYAASDTNGGARQHSPKSCDAQPKLHTIVNDCIAKEQARREGAGQGAAHLRASAWLAEAMRGQASDARATVDTAAGNTSATRTKYIPIKLRRSDTPTRTRGKATEQRRHAHTTLTAAKPLRGGTEAGARRAATRAKTHTVVVRTSAIDRGRVTHATPVKMGATAGQIPCRGMGKRISMETACAVRASLVYPHCAMQSLQPPAVRSSRLRRCAQCAVVVRHCMPAPAPAAAAHGRCVHACGSVGVAGVWLQSRRRRTASDSRC